MTLVIHAGRSTGGIESTIVAVLPGEPVRLLRLGGINREDLAPVPRSPSESLGLGIEAPG